MAHAMWTAVASTPLCLEAKPLCLLTLLRLPQEPNRSAGSQSGVAPPHSKMPNVAAELRPVF